MRNLSAAILILSILIFQFSELLIFVSFKINQDYIAKNLCVEKDIEDSTCNGCCHLKKKVNEQQEQKAELPPNQSEKQNITFYKQNLLPDSLINPSVKLLQQKPSKQYSFISLHSIFHPPQQVV